MSTNTEGAKPVVKYPECEKMSQVRPQSQAIGEFLEWLRYEKGWVLATVPEEYEFTLVEASYSIEGLLAEFFGIDLDKVETERRQMLDEIRAVHEEDRT